jgi:hypothetical protein
MPVPSQALPYNATCQVSHADGDQRTKETLQKGVKQHPPTGAFPLQLLLPPAYIHTTPHRLAMYQPNPAIGTPTSYLPAQTRRAKPAPKTRHTQKPQRIAHTQKMCRLSAAGQRLPSAKRHR